MSWLVLGTAMWLGFLTSISPCPLASNIAAISYIGKDVEDRRRVLFAGLLYTIGRALTYILLAVLLMAGLAVAGDLSRSLQRYGAAFLGPILIVIGMVLLGWLGGGLQIQAGSESTRLRLARMGLIGPFLLGVLFALSFCPISAGLYFGGLLPLSIENGSSMVLPGLFGLGTALPVVFFALLIAFAGGAVGRSFDRIRQVERFIRITLGTGLIVAGIYYSLKYTYQFI